MAEKRVIITGDDFGLSAENNAGIIAAHQHGVLSAASLMVGGDAVQEAIDYAQRYPALAVGLHINFSDTKPVLPPEKVYMLVRSDGYFPADDSAHRSALLSVTGQRQIREEVAAQFRKFYMTGLICDHINGHRHAHMRHPLMPFLILPEASRWQVKTWRVPWDPPTDTVRWLRALMLRRMGAFYGLKAPDRSINRTWNADELADFLLKLPSGTTELFFHPVEASEHPFAGDLPILLDGGVKAALADARLCSMQTALEQN